MPKPYFDVVVVVPLQEELDQLQKVFAVRADHSENAELRLEMQLEDSPLTILCVLQDDMGKSAASSATTRALRWCDTGIVVCVGIGGGISKDLKIGDVAYAGNILDVYDNTKNIDKSDDSIETQLSPKPYVTSREIMVTCNFVRALPSLRPKLDAFRSMTDVARKATGLTSYSGRAGKTERLEQAKFLPGCIICGAVSKSVIYNKQLQTLDRRILAIDTESGGIFEAAATFETDSLSIRGISDYADGDKKKLEEETSGRLRELAAYNASCFLALQLRNTAFQEELLKRRRFSRGSDNQLSLGLPVENISKVLERIFTYLDEYLRALSPLYRTQPSGFRLPVPRLKLRRGSGVAKEKPIEFVDILKKRDRIVVVLPRMYPDAGLPCVVAQELLYNIIDNKQPIPILIDAKTFSPPQSLLDLAAEKFEAIANIEGALPVLVIANPPCNSRTKLSAFCRSLNELSGVKVIVFVSARDSSDPDGSLNDLIGAESVSLERVSFREIAFFLQRNFSLPSSESEVIALKLNNAFAKFKLSSHPGFFAGLPKNTLSALLQANKRSELLQLAVDGFLSYVVAGEQDRDENIVLSRTKRADFLGEFIFQMHVEKRIFRDSDLVAHAESFLAQYDIDLTAATFVSNFFDNGIITHIDSHAIVALPFIEEYLLALSLKNNSMAAISYFDIDNINFDKNAFDIYCELGPSKDLVSSFISKLNASIEELAKEKTHNAYLTDEIYRALGSREQLERLQSSLDRILEDVTSDKDILQSKQNSLDIADAVRERMAESTEFGIDFDKREKEYASDNYTLAYHRFSCACLLLGSGSESLKKDQKRDLIKSIVTLGDLLVSNCTNQVLKVDFEPVKQELLKPEFIKRFSGKGLSEEEVEKSIGGFFDLFKRIVTSMPLFFVLGTVCEHASHKLLSSSLASQLPAFDNNLFAKLINALWLAESDFEKGIAPLSQVVKSLPRAEFLRAHVVAHIITRVKWTHWKKPNRLALLDLADDVLKPLGQANKEKGKLKREVSASADKAFEGEEKR